MAKTKTKEMKTTRIGIRISIVDHRKIEKLAKKSKMRTSEYVRHVAMIEHDNDLLIKIKEQEDIIEKREIEYRKLFKTAKKATSLVTELGQMLDYKITSNIVGYKNKEIIDKLKLEHNKKLILKTGKKYTEKKKVIKDRKVK